MLLKKKNKIVVEGDSDSGDGDVQTVFGDLVCFIMMLFILLFVLSYNENKTDDFITEFQIKFGEKEEEKQQTLTTDALLVSKIEHYIDKEQLDEFAKVVVDEHRVKLILNPPILFDSGKAILKPEGKKVLDSAGEIYDTVFNPIVIEGHTDNVPINTNDYPSNWELSFFRAFSVVKYYIFSRNYKPTRLSAMGYGEYKPLVGNETRFDRSLNRRIEINIIRLSEAGKKDEFESGY